MIAGELEPILAGNFPYHIFVTGAPPGALQIDRVRNFPISISMLDCQRAADLGAEMANGDDSVVQRDDEFVRHAGYRQRRSIECRADNDADRRCGLDRVARQPRYRLDLR